MIETRLPAEPTAQPASFVAGDHVHHVTADPLGRRDCDLQGPERRRIDTLADRCSRLVDQERDAPREIAAARDRMVRIASQFGAQISGR